MTNIIEEAYTGLVVNIQKYGWYLVGFGMIIYYVMPYVRSKLKKLSIERANDPRRRNILDQDKKRIRESQQKRLGD